MVEIMMENLAIADVTIWLEACQSKRLMDLEVEAYRGHYYSISILF